MKAFLCLVIFSVAIALVSANYFDGEDDDEDEYEMTAQDEDEDEYEMEPQEDTKISLFQLVEGLQALQDEMTMEKRGKKGKGKKGKGKKGKGKGKGKGGKKSKVGPCVRPDGQFCEVCNLKKVENDMSRYMICGGGTKTAINGQ